MTMNYCKSLFMALLLIIGLGHTQESTATGISSLLSENWTIFFDAQIPQDLSTISQNLTGIDGKPITPKTVQANNGRIDLAAIYNKPGTKSEALMFNEFYCKSGCVLNAGFSADWWMEIYLNGKLAYSTMQVGNVSPYFTPQDHQVKLNCTPGKNILAVKVKSGSNGWLLVFGDYINNDKRDIVFTQNEQWKAVNLDHLYITPDSALDLSEISKLNLTHNHRLPRLIINQAGKLAQAGTPDKTIRLNGFNLSTSWLLGYWGHAWPALERKQIPQYLQACRRQGYNAIRLNGLFDSISPKETMSIDNRLLDLADYWLAEMSKAGIYALTNIFAYKYSMARENWWKQSISKYKAKMYIGDKFMRDSWRYTAQTLLNHINPYTGIAWKDDPTIALIEYFNEQEFGLVRLNKLSCETRKKFDLQFQHWLIIKYKSVEKIATSWKTQINDLSKITSPEKGVNAEGKSGADFAEFCTQLASENAKWYAGILQEIGYNGLQAQYSLPLWYGDNLARYQTSEVAIRNNYFHHPSNQSKPGSRCQQVSSIAEASGYWRRTNASRFSDRPFIMTEYNHPFWNKYKYEGGALFGGYSAFQDFSALIVHSDAVQPNTVKPADAFSVANNPVARANEFISTLLFLRRDLKTAQGKVIMQISQKWLKNNFGSLTSTQDKIGLITGFAIDFPWAEKPAGTIKKPEVDLILTPQNGSTTVSAEWSAELKDSTDTAFSNEDITVTLKNKNILPASNKSNPAKGIFQTDTGEIELDTKLNQLKIITPKTEILVATDMKAQKLDILEIISNNTPSMIAASSVDGKMLSESDRIVLVYSTQSANTNMKITYNQEELKNIGTLPVLVKTGHFTVSLHSNDLTRKAKLFALDINGARTQELNIKVNNTGYIADIDIAKLKNGPAFFFELIRQ